MRILKTRPHLTAPPCPPTIADGFLPPSAELPALRLDVPQDRRERAALMVLAMIHWQTPEEVVLGVAPEVVEAFTSLERAEALAHVDLIIDVLCPR